jgi:small subunit ribosomal protein S17
MPLRQPCFRLPLTPSLTRGLSDAAHSQVDLEAEYSAEVADVMSTYEQHASKKQFMIGRVISDKAAKSITVAVQRRKFVSKYNSYQRWTKKVMAHDEEEQCRVGDIVRIIPCKPKSKKKRHAICDILFKEPQIEVSKDAI